MKVPVLCARLHEWRGSVPTLEEAPQQTHRDGPVLRVGGTCSPKSLLFALLSKGSSAFPEGNEWIDANFV